MGVTLGDLNVLLPRKRLRQLGIPRRFENGGDKIVSERVGSDVTFGFASGIIVVASECDSCYYF